MGLTYTQYVALLALLEEDGRTVSQLVPQEGEFSSTPWRQDAEYAGGPHLDGGVHHFAQIRLLCGDAQRVSGVIQDANSIFGGPSDLAMTLAFTSGAAGSYTASYPEYRVPEEPNDMRIYGTEGVMSIAGRSTISVFRPDGSALKLRQQVFVAFRGVGTEPAERLAAALNEIAGQIGLQPLDPGACGGRDVGQRDRSGGAVGVVAPGERRPGLEQ